MLPTYQLSDATANSHANLHHVSFTVVCNTTKQMLHCLAFESERQFRDGSLKRASVQFTCRRKKKTMTHTFVFHAYFTHRYSELFVILNTVPYFMLLC